MGDVTYNQIMGDNLFSRKSIPPDIVCEDCGSKWTAMLIDIPVCLLINDMDKYSRMLCNNMFGAPDPPLVLYVFRPSDKELMDGKISLTCVVPSHSSPLQWRVSHNAAGLRAPKGCQIMPVKCNTHSVILEASNSAFQQDLDIKVEEIEFEKREDVSNTSEIENFNLGQIEEDSEDPLNLESQMLTRTTEIHNVDNRVTTSSLDPTTNTPMISSIYKINRSSASASTPTVWTAIPAAFIAAHHFMATPTPTPTTTEAAFNASRTFLTTTPTAASKEAAVSTLRTLLPKTPTAAASEAVISTSSSKPSEYQNIRKRPRENLRDTEEPSGNRSSIELAASSSTDMTDNVNSLENRESEVSKNQAGPVDPEIDEHFRRSLGANYQQLFKNTQPKPQHNTDSVDKKKGLRKCPVCYKFMQGSNISRHIDSHGLDPSEKEIILHRSRKRKKIAVGGQLCPLEQCRGLEPYQRLDNHLKRAHKMNPQSNEYGMYVKKRNGYKQSTNERNR